MDTTTVAPSRASLRREAKEKKRVAAEVTGLTDRMMRFQAWANSQSPRYLSFLNILLDEIGHKAREIRSAIPADRKAAQTAWRKARDTIATFDFLAAEGRRFEKAPDEMTSDLGRVSNYRGFLRSLSKSRKNTTQDGLPGIGLGLSEDSTQTENSAQPRAAETFPFLSEVDEQCRPMCGAFQTRYGSRRRRKQHMR